MSLFSGTASTIKARTKSDKLFFFYFQSTASFRLDLLSWLILDEADR